MRRNFKERVLREKCPLCGAFEHVGSCGHGRFFCCECCVEFRVDGDKVTIYTILEDGNVEKLKIMEVAK